MPGTKCCKKPKCDTTQNKCIKKDFMFSPMFWKLLAVANFLIIILRVTYLNKFNFDLKLLFFLMWLELQIIAFYILLISAIYIYTAVYKLLLLDLSFLKALFSKRITNRFMKWLTLINTDNISVVTVRGTVKERIKKITDTISARKKTFNNYETR